MHEPTVKDPGVEHEYTMEEAKTLFKCRKSFAEFAKLVMITSLAEGLVPFRMYDYQEEMVSVFSENKFTIVLSSRQSGKCVHGNTPVLVREVATGVEQNVTISELMKLGKVKKVRDAKITAEAVIEGFEVMTPAGWKPFRSVGKTRPFREVIVRLHSGKTIHCADDHLFQRGEQSFYAKSALGRVVDTTEGPDFITQVEETGKTTSMYDLCDVDGGIYYTNGIASHNSTTVAAFALWYAMFNDRKGIGVVSNKASSAQEILYRIKDMYESLPDYIKPGVLEWNKMSVEFENKTRIQTAATSKDSFRGRSMNIVICLNGDTPVRTINATEPVDHIGLWDTAPILEVFDDLCERGCEQIINLIGPYEQTIVKNESGMLVAGGRQTISREKFEGIMRTKRIDGGKINTIIVTAVDCYGKRRSIECTEDHRLTTICDGEFKHIRAAEVSQSDVLFAYTDEFDSATYCDMRVESVERSALDEVYDFVNSESHHVWANGFISHQCDELAFVPPGLADEFWTSNYPVISTDPNAKIMVISTPNGMFNLFHKLYSEAWDLEDLRAFKAGHCPEGIDPLQKNSFVRLKYDWRAVPGRDEEWERETRSNMNDIKFAQEYEVNFLGSTATVVGPECLGRLLSETTYEPVGYASNKRLRIYEEPTPECVGYIIGADPAKGTGKHDATMQVFKVVSVDPISLVQVAVFQDNNTDPHEFAGIVDMLSKKYRNAKILVENNGEGSAVVQHLWWTYESENMYCESSKRTGMGLRATAQNKSRAVILMKRFLEDKNLKLMDRETVKQLATYIEDDRGSTHGQQGKPDDLVSALYWACYAMELEIFDDVTIISNGDDGTDYEVWGILADHDIDEENSFDWLAY